METRSSPSLQVLQGLARQAHIDVDDVSALSKPALFGHLRSNYDYDRLERAHQVALKRGDGGNASSGANGNSTGEPAAARRSKRHCRAGHQAAAAAAAAKAADAAGESSSARPREEEGLPPASIFVQTRSRSRMLAAAGGAGGVSGVGGVGGSARGAPHGRSASSAARAAGSGRNRRGTASPRGRTRPLKLSGGRGGGGTSSSAGDKGGGSGSNAGGGGSSGVRRSTAVADGAREEAEDACGAEARRADGVAASEGAGAEKAGKRKGRRGAGRGALPSRKKGKGKANAKGKRKRSDGGGCKGEQACDDGGRDGKISSGDGVGGGKEEEEAEVEEAEAEEEEEEEEKMAEGGPNELDPIMLVKVGKDSYRFVRPNGRVVMYNLDSLVDYFISTGDFLEPETRLPFSDDELRDIDYKVKAAGLSKPSVLDAKRDPCRYTEQKFQQDALVGLERMISELVTGMLRVVEESDREEGEIRLVTEIFPPFADLFKQIWAADRAFASQCMQHYTSWLQGPPNRPTEDEMGFLDVILGFLKQLQECEGNSSLGF